MAIFMKLFPRYRYFLNKQPWLGRPVPCFERLYLVCVLQRQADLIQSIQKAMFAERVDVESETLTTRRGNRLVLQVNIQPVALGRLHFAKQLIHGLGIEHNREQTDLEAIIEENISETGRNDDLEAKILNRPGRMLPAGPAAKIGAREQYLRA